MSNKDLRQAAWSWPRIFLLLICLAIRGSAQAGQSAVALQTLEAGASLDREVKPNEIHVYKLVLSEGQYLAAALAEHNANLRLKFSAPDGAVLATQETALGNNDSADFRIIVNSSGEFRMEIANLSKDTGRYELRIEAIRLPNEADRAAAKAHQTWRQARELERQGTPESRRRAIEANLEVLTYLQQSGNRKAEAELITNIGVLYFYLDERRKAIASFEQTLAVSREIDAPLIEAIALNNLGGLYQEMGESQRAAEYLARALPVLRSLGDKFKEAAGVHNLGWSQQTLGEFRKAADSYREALPLWQAAGNTGGEAQTVNNLGLIYYQLGDLRRSFDHFQSALVLRQTLQDGRGESQTLGNLARLRAALGDIQEARTLFEQALATARRVEDRVNQSSALIGLSGLVSNVAEAGRGFEYINEALSLIRAAGDRRMEAIALSNLGNLHRLRGDTASAAREYEQAYSLQTVAGDSRMASETLFAWAQLLSDQGKLDEARGLMERAFEVVESLRGRVAEPDLRTSFLASIQSYYDVYIDVLMQLHARVPTQGYAFTALQVSEQARSRGLLDALAENQAEIRQGTEPSLMERELQLQQALNAKDQQLRGLLVRPDAAARVAEAKRELDGLLDDLRQLQGEIRSRNPRYASLVQPPPVSLEGLQRDLDKDSLLLEYWLGRQRSYLWVVTEDSLNTYVLPGESIIEEAVRQYVTALTARASPKPLPKQQLTPERLAANLSAILLGPVAPRLEKKRLIIVSHGALHYVPFAALPLPSSSMLLVDHHEIVSLPSGSVLTALRAEAKKQRSPDKLAAILADPVFSRDDPRFNRRLSGSLSAASPAQAEELQRSAEESGLDGLRRLRFSRVEADAISSLFRSEGRLKAVDFQASRTTALSSDLGQYRILHFATHGLVNSVHPELSGLVFSTVNEAGEPQDGLLRLHEIFNLSLNAELVVLSACQTALGKEIKGEGLIGLTRGFMYAGTPRVVASLWNVEDRATAELMKRFYEGMLKKQLKPAAALHEAQLALRHDKRWSSPYFWAGFVLQGDWK